MTKTTIFSKSFARRIAHRKNDPQAKHHHMYIKDGVFHHLITKVAPRTRVVTITEAPTPTPSPVREFTQLPEGFVFGPPRAEPEIIEISDDEDSIDLSHEESGYEPPELLDLDADPEYVPSFIATSIFSHIETPVTVADHEPTFITSHFPNQWRVISLAQSPIDRAQEPHFQRFVVYPPMEYDDPDCFGLNPDEYAAVRRYTDNWFDRYMMINDFIGVRTPDWVIQTVKITTKITYLGNKQFRVTSRIDEFEPFDIYLLDLTPVLCPEPQLRMWQRENNLRLAEDQRRDLSYNE